VERKCPGREAAAGAGVEAGGDPGAHHARGEELGEAVLDVRTVECAGVVAGLSLVDAGKDAGVEPGTAAAAELDTRLRMGGPEPVDHGVEVT
jgi:hypothetical protein